MTQFNVILLISSLSIISGTYGYNILCVFPAPSRSHNHLAKGIVDSLLKAGHEVTWATPYPDPKPVKNLKLIDMQSIQSIKPNITLTHRVALNMSMVVDFGKRLSVEAVNNEDVRRAVTTTQFDAVVTEWFFSDILAGFAAVQQVPWILLNGNAMHPHMEFLADDIRSATTVPLFLTDYTMPMNLWQRLGNVFIAGSMQLGTLMRISSDASTYESLFKPLAAARGVTLPPYTDALYNISIVLVNSHPSISPAMSLPPNVIDVGGYHIPEDVPPLPKDLQDILDSSPQGVIYFSMGSVLKSADFLEETKQDLIRMLGTLPYTVLWKFEEKLEGLPKNVHIRPWMPQPSILAHRNVKLFITHGGMLSSLEAVHYGVPLLAVPVFGDQPNNAARAVRAGYARSVNFAPDMAAPLRRELDHMLADDSYYKTAKYLSMLFRKRPVAPAKLVSHYIELAIVTKGAVHLRSKTHLYAWYERYMLDALALITVALLALYLALRSLLRRLLKKITKTEKKKKN